MPIILMHAVALALAATAALWFAPISFGSKSEPPAEAPSPSRTQRIPLAHGLHLRHERFE